MRCYDRPPKKISEHKSAVKFTRCAWAGGTPGRILSQVDIRFWRVIYLFLSNRMLTVIDVTLLLRLFSCRINHNISATQTQPYRTDGQTDTNTRYAWAGGTFFPVVLSCQYFDLVRNRF
jgi:hypothetical protein